MKFTLITVFTLVVSIVHLTSSAPVEPSPQPPKEKPQPNPLPPSPPKEKPQPNPPSPNSAESEASLEERQVTRPVVGLARHPVPPVNPPSAAAAEKRQVARPVVGLARGPVPHVFPGESSTLEERQVARPVVGLARHPVPPVFPPTAVKARQVARPVPVGPQPGPIPPPFPFDGREIAHPVSGEQPTGAVTASAVYSKVPAPTSTAARTNGFNLTLNHTAIQELAKATGQDPNKITRLPDGRNITEAEIWGFISKHSNHPGKRNLVEREAKAGPATSEQLNTTLEEIVEFIRTHPSAYDGYGKHGELVEREAQLDRPPPEIPATIAFCMMRWSIGKGPGPKTPKQQNEAYCTCEQLMKPPPCSVQPRLAKRDPIELMMDHAPFDLQLRKRQFGNGPVLDQCIVDFAKERGGFKSIDEFFETVNWCIPSTPAPSVTNRAASEQSEVKPANESYHKKRDPVPNDELKRLNDIFTHCLGEWSDAQGKDFTVEKWGKIGVPLCYNSTFPAGTFPIEKREAPSTEQDLANEYYICLARWKEDHGDFTESELRSQGVPTCFIPVLAFLKKHPNEPAAYVKRQSSQEDFDKCIDDYTKQHKNDDTVFFDAVNFCLGLDGGFFREKLAKRSSEPPRPALGIWHVDFVQYKNTQDWCMHQNVVSLHGRPEFESKDEETHAFLVCQDAIRKTSLLLKKPAEQVNRVDLLGSPFEFRRRDLNDMVKRARDEEAFNCFINWFNNHGNVAPANDEEVLDIFAACA